VPAPAQLPGSAAKEGFCGGSFGERVGSNGASTLRKQDISAAGQWGIPREYMRFAVLSKSIHNYLGGAYAHYLPAPRLRSGQAPAQDKPGAWTAQSLFFDNPTA